jgi:hypothetical protein
LAKAFVCYPKLAKAYVPKRLTGVNFRFRTNPYLIHPIYGNVEGRMDNLSELAIIGVACAGAMFFVSALVF